MVKSQMGLHFNPEFSRESGYPKTADYWESVRDLFNRGDDKQKYLIEAIFHALGDWEHESSYDEPEELDNIVAFAKVAAGC